MPSARARVRTPEISDLKDLDRVAERWKPYRAWAARLLWLDLLGYDGSGAHIVTVRWVPGNTTYPLRSNRFSILKSSHDSL